MCVGLICWSLLAGWSFTSEKKREEKRGRKRRSKREGEREVGNEAEKVMRRS